MPSKRDSKQKQAEENQSGASRDTAQAENRQPQQGDADNLAVPNEVIATNEKASEKGDVRTFINPENGSTLVGTKAQFDALGLEDADKYEDRGAVRDPDFVIGDELRDSAPEDLMTTVIDEDGLPTTG